MAKYDDASWHYGGDFPEGLDNEHAAIHIGIFLTWCIDNNLMSAFQMEEAGEDIQMVKDRAMTGAQFLMSNCDEKFTDEDLNDTGNHFAADYYNEDADFAKQFAPYLQDYCFLFEERAKSKNQVFETVYQLADSWDNYDLVKPVIDKRFAEWRQYARK